MVYTGSLPHLVFIALAKFCVGLTRFEQYQSSPSRSRSYQRKHNILEQFQRQSGITLCHRGQQANHPRKQPAKRKA